MRFASYGAGIDRGSLEAIEALLATDRAVASVGRYRWGREGEITLCVRVRSAQDAARLFDLARTRIPAAPRGPVQMSTPSGLRFSAPPAE